MKLNEDQLTALGLGTDISFFVKDETPVYAGTSSRDGGMVLHMGPVTLFFDENNEMELVNLILDWRKRQGKRTL